MGVSNIKEQVYRILFLTTGLLLGNWENRNNSVALFHSHEVMRDYLVTTCFNVTLLEGAEMIKQ